MAMDELIKFENKNTMVVFRDFDEEGTQRWVVELEADYRSYGSPAIAHKRADHSALKPIDRINLGLVHHELYCAT